MKKEFNSPERHQPLSEEALKSLEELGAVLRSILMRLIKEGKAKVVDGKVIFIKQDE